MGVEVDATASGAAPPVGVGSRASTVEAIAASVVARTSGAGLDGACAVAIAACTCPSISMGVSVGEAEAPLRGPMKSSTRDLTSSLVV